MTGRMEINPAVMLGKPVIRDTRIPVELLLRMLSEGASVEDLVSRFRSSWHKFTAIESSIPALVIPSAPRNLLFCRRTVNALTADSSRSLPELGKNIFGAHAKP